MYSPATTTAQRSRSFSSSLDEDLAAAGADQIHILQLPTPTGFN